MNKEVRILVVCVVEMLAPYSCTHTHHFYTNTVDVHPYVLVIVTTAKATVATFRSSGRSEYSKASKLSQESVVSSL